MRHSYTLTKKGQLTLPRQVREKLGLQSLSRVSVIFDEKKRMVQIEPVKDIIDLAGSIKTKKQVDVMRLRELFEKQYERK